MNQTQARKLARELNEEQGGRTSGLLMPWIAITKDHFHGRWEATNEWGVMQGRMWFDHDPRQTEQPGPDAELGTADTGIDWGEQVEGQTTFGTPDPAEDLLPLDTQDPEFPAGYNPRTGQRMTPACEIPDCGCTGEAHP